jgi:hypothetical protein
VSRLVPALDFTLKWQDNLLFLPLSKCDVRHRAKSVILSFRDDEEVPGELSDGEKAYAKLSNKLPPTLTAVDVGGGRYPKFLPLFAAFRASSDVLYQLSDHLRTKPAPVITNGNLSKSRCIS